MRVPAGSHSPCVMSLVQSRVLLLLHSRFRLFPRISPLNYNMPIAPITGKLRKRLWLDLSVAIGLGVSSAYAYW